MTSQSQKRVLLAFALTSVTALLLLWFLSASALSERDPKTLLVFANNPPTSSSRTYRVLAFDAQKKRPLNDVLALRLENNKGTKAQKVSKTMTRTSFEVGRIRGHLLEHPVDVAVDESVALSSELKLMPWHSIVMRGAREPILISEAGVPSAHFENKVWRHSKGQYQKVLLRRGAQHLESDDGRWLKLSYNALRASAPVFTKGPLEIELELKENSYVLVELVADSKVVGFYEYPLMQEGKHHLSFLLDEVPPKTKLVSARFFRSPFSQEPSARVHALFEDTPPTLDTVKESLVTLVGQEVLEDPVLKLMQGVDKRALSSIFSRLFYTQAHAPNIAETREEQLLHAKRQREARSWRYRVPFRALSGFVCIALCLVAFVFAQKVAGPYRSRRGLLAGSLALLIGLVIFFVLDYALTLMGTRVA